MEKPIKQVRVTIELGNDNVLHLAQVGTQLRVLGRRLFDGERPETVQDGNGNTVGKVEYVPAD